TSVGYGCPPSWRGTPTAAENPRPPLSLGLTRACTVEIGRRDGGIGGRPTECRQGTHGVIADGDDHPSRQEALYDRRHVRRREAVGPGHLLHARASPPREVDPAATLERTGRPEQRGRVVLAVQRG